MAGLYGIVRYPVASTGTGTKTLLQITAPTNQRLVIKEIGITFQGIGPVDAPVQTQVIDQTSAGTMTSVTPALENDADTETLQATASRDASAEPTAGNIRKEWFIHPQGPGVLWQEQPGDKMVIGGGKRLGIKVITPSVSVPAAIYVRYEE